MRKSNSLVPSASGKCLKPISIVNGSLFTLPLNCDDHTRFDRTAFGLLRQIKTASVYAHAVVLHPREGQYHVWQDDEVSFKHSSCAVVDIYRARGLKCLPLDVLWDPRCRRVNKFSEKFARAKYTFYVRKSLFCLRFNFLIFNFLVEMKHAQHMLSYIQIPSKFSIVAPLIVIEQPLLLKCC